MIDTLCEVTKQIMNVFFWDTSILLTGFLIKSIAITAVSCLIAIIFKPAEEKEAKEEPFFIDGVPGEKYDIFKGIDEQDGPV
jgi:hypothetical protein